MKQPAAYLKLLICALLILCCSCSVVIAGRGGGGGGGRSSSGGGSSSGGRSSSSGRSSGRNSGSRSSGVGSKRSVVAGNQVSRIASKQKSGKPSVKGGVKGRVVKKGDTLTIAGGKIVVKKGDTVSEIAYKLAQERHVPYQQMYKAIYEANRQLLGDRTQMFNKYGAKMRLHGKLGDYQFRDAIKPGDELKLPSYGLGLKDPPPSNIITPDKPTPRPGPGGDTPTPTPVIPGGDDPVPPPYVPVIPDKPPVPVIPDPVIPYNPPVPVIPDKPIPKPTPIPDGPIIDTRPIYPRPRPPKPVVQDGGDDSGKRVVLRHARLRGRGVFIKVNVNINGQPNQTK